MKEKYSHNVQKGNGTTNDALATIADLLVETGNDSNKSQKKNFIWIIITAIISLLSLVVALCK